MDPFALAILLAIVAPYPLAGLLFGTLMVAGFYGAAVVGLVQVFRR